MIVLYNNVANYSRKCESEAEFINFVTLLFNENEETELSAPITGIQCIDYVNRYCGNWEILFNQLIK